MTTEGKRRLIDVALEAEDTVDMFISCAILGKRKRTPLMFHKEAKLCNRAFYFVLDRSFNLVINDIKYMRNEMSYIKGSDMMDNNLEPTGTSSSKTKKLEKSRTIEHEEVIVGFEEDALSILDRLTGDRKRLKIISIVGMGGLGKTTLATKVFRDQYVVYYFDIRGWITVSQAYSNRDLLLKLLGSIGVSVHEATGEPKLCDIMYKSLKGRKYFIVIDDIWSVEAWNDLGLCFPDDNNGSRVLITTRLTEVACRGCFIHNLQYLTQDQSWELLCRKTFRGYECPENLIETGKHIAKRCQGLPLALVVIGGLLEKGEKKKAQWQKVLQSVNSYIVKDPKGCLDTLALSYDHTLSLEKVLSLYRRLSRRL